MAILIFLQSNWFEVLSALGIIGGLCFNGLAQWSDDRSRRVSNLIAITSNQRDIWKEYSRRPQLARVAMDVVDVEREPITSAESEFINWIILHLNTVFVARKENQLPMMNGIERDVSDYFRKPLARSVWNSVSQFHNPDFVKFMADCIEAGSQQQ